MAKKASPKAASSPYSVHPMITYAQAVLNNLPKTSGKSLDQWLALLKNKRFDDEKQCTSWLKSEHKLGSTTASMITEVWAGRGEEFSAEHYLATADQSVEAMYATKQSLRPIHNRLIELVRKLGSDVKICPCKTIVPFYRNHVFAEIKPSTKTRIDFGLALKGYDGKFPKRLIDTGGLKKNDRITHRIPLSSVDDIDDDVKQWMKIAYDLDE